MGSSTLTHKLNEVQVPRDSRSAAVVIGLRIVLDMLVPMLYGVAGMMALGPNA